MATVISGNTIKLNNGQTVQASQGGWYDGSQFWGGTLSAPGVINSQSNQVGAGQAVSEEVNRQTSVAAGLAPNANQDYINAQRALQQPNKTAPMTTNYGASGSYGSTGAGGGIPGGMGGFTQPTLDLNALYQNLYKTAGIADLESQYSSQTKAFNDAQSKINDNPFLSEANRVGRAQKLQIDYNNATAGIQKDIATKKADVETQLNIATKQFDINSQAAKQALDQFNSLLESGALAGASGEDIANITRATGISSGMIQSAIEANKAKNVKSQTIQFDDGNEMGYVVINEQTGEIISKQVIGASKPSAAEEKAALGGGGSSGGSSSNLTSSQSNALTKSARAAIVTADTAKGKANADKALSLSEFEQAIAAIMQSAAVDQETAKHYAAQAMADLGYTTWKWSTK